MEFDLPQKVVQGLAGAIKGLRLYPAQHPAIQRQFEALQTNFYAAFTDADSLRLGLLEGSLFFGEMLFTDELPAAQELTRLFTQLELDGLEFRKGLSTPDLNVLATLLDGAALKGEAFAAELQARGIEHIHAVVARTSDEPPVDRAPRKVYSRALKVVDSVFEDVRLGKIPSSAEAREVVREMARLTLTDPHALFALSMLKDYDNYTFTHSVNVSVIALAVGRACGLGEEELRTLGLGGLLHDLGKLKIDISIINKPGRLTEEEFDQIRKHPRTGADIVAEMEGVTAGVIDIVLGHHLHYNRKGYPADARGRAVSPLADMAAIADSYDAMTTLRSYQQPVTPRKAIKMLREVTGTILHPDFVEKFIASLGSYPVGTLVRLNSNEIGLVVRVGIDCPDDVQLKILFDSDGEPLDDPLLMELSSDNARRIVAEVDPFVRGIDVTDYFE
ncbi:HD domain-containing protein [Desulfuromonas carbonis]|uniref:HD-GYP domain-containing protein n=1 Tax=Desulfuromonas sp. DDH964 TaxID=1823759 RepID=UPI00078B5A5A|nr:HD domain-containing phosphohydrolase [Desulfuromonas sp. DDH964]AMV71316.1 cyclic diguanylate phosphodiesterase [Desulfuromonas sp. DDH964]